MARQQKFDYQAALEIDLMAHPDGLTLDQLLEHSGFKVDRSTLFRHLSRLIAQGRAERIGKARASRYRPLAAAAIPADAPSAYTRRPSLPGVEEMLQRYLPGETPFLAPGEVQRLHLAGRVEIAAAPGTYARRIYERLAVDLAHASSRLEGGSYSLAETERLLKHGDVPADRDSREAVMILNHGEAIRFIVDNLATVDLTGPDLLHLHTLLSKGLLSGPPGAESLPQVSGETGGFAPAAADNPDRHKEAFDTLLAKLLQVKDPFEKAFCLFAFLPNLRLFAEGDMGTSRVGLNIPLLKHELCPLSFIGVDERAFAEGTAEVYESNDTRRLKQLFIDGYVRSAENYRQLGAEAASVPGATPEYDAVVKKAVRTIVREWKRFNRVNLEIYLSLLVKPAHLHAVAEEVEQELAGLQADNLAGFGLSPAEFAGYTPPASGAAPGE